MSRAAEIRSIRIPKAAPVHPFDSLYGTETGGLMPREQILTGHANDQHLTAYYGVAPSILHGLVALWLQTRPAMPIDRSTFVDIGAGKGRAMMAASLHPFQQVIGIERNPTLAKIARSNLDLFARSASPLSPVTLVEGDVFEVPFPDTAIVAFMFHPFEEPLVRKLLQRVERHVDRRAGTSEATFDLLYVNAEHASVPDHSPRFQRLFFGKIPMSPEDHLADLAEIAEQQEYGSTGDEICAVYRLKPKPAPRRSRNVSPPAN